MEYERRYSQARREHVEVDYLEFEADGKSKGAEEAEDKRCDKEIYSEGQKLKIFFLFAYYYYPSWSYLYLQERLKYNTVLPDEFNEYFREFDDRLIYYIQYYNPEKQGLKNKILGYCLKLISMFFNAFTMIEYGQAYSLFFQLISQDYLSVINIKTQI